MIVLALESSTSSAKALLYDSQKGTIGLEACAYPPEICGGGRIDTEAVFRLTAQMGRRLAERHAIEAIALCGIWHSVALCDGAMRPAGGTYAWHYMAPGAYCRSIRKNEALTGTLYSRTGCMPHVTYPRDMLSFMHAQGADLSNKKLPSQGAYNFYRLTGEFWESACTMSGSGLLNIHTLAYDECALDYAGIRESQLGSLARSPQAAPITAAGAALLGVGANTPVVSAHADGALNQIAAGAAAVGRMTLSVGTSGAIRLTADRPVLPDCRQLWCYYGAMDWMSGAAVAGAANCVDWFHDKVMGKRVSLEELEASPLAPEPPVFLPFLFGERCPNWQDERLGGFCGVRPEHTAADLYFALQAGVLFNLYQCYEALRASAGVPQSIHASGGILHSKRWTQMAADIFGMPLRCSRNLNASSLGAAALALHAAGGLRDLRAFDGTGEEHIAAPDPEAARRYRVLYERYLYYYGKTAET
ncbi:MAG: hypothetical protein LBU67_03320 [Oscillospiraceae bacterium]|jgi:gluconokinase|nr:hypothetical protein [Oscillospiraceae bacterium]